MCTHPPANRITAPQARTAANAGALHGFFAALLVVGALLVRLGASQARAQSTPAPGGTPDTLLPVSAQPPVALAPAAVAAAQAAVVRIEVAGPYRLPYTTPARVQAATGSGFLVAAGGANSVDEAAATAVVVTNAHVAIRGTDYSVYFDGSVDPLPATLLGVSECSDIAVLQVAAANLPSLAWRPTAVAASDAVYAAGYPGGVFDIVVTGGAVQSVETDDETEWASVKSVLNHTAATDPGSSGGPLLDAAGNVAGIVFAESGSFADRNYAISAADGAAVVEILRSGDSAESIGVTAEALPRNASLAGVWIIAVEADSPAARAGMLPGDIIRKLNRRNVGRDGTLASYCRILRSGSADPLPIQVYRPDTGQVLEGEINGVPLAPSGRFDANLVPTATPAPLPPILPTPQPADLHDVSDETGILTLRVPKSWSYLLNDPQRVGTVVFSPSLVLAEDERSFAAGRAPFVRAWTLQRDDNADRFAAEFFAEASDIANCTPIVTTLESGAWRGDVHSFDHCPGFEGAQFVAAILTPAIDNSVVVYIDQLLPVGTPHFALETLIEPLAATLLPRIPFWEPPRATVLVEGLNVRAGPSMEDEVVTTLHEGETLPVLGKDSAACNWIYFYFTNLDGWSSAAPQYTQLDRACADITVITPAEIAEFKAGR